MNNPVWSTMIRGKSLSRNTGFKVFLPGIQCAVSTNAYTVDGPLPDESKLKRTIYEEISPGCARSHRQ